MTVWDEFKKTAGVEPVSIDGLNREALKSPPNPSAAVNANPEIEVTPEYQRVLDWLNVNAPIIFVTGKAGTGKTTLVHFLRGTFSGNTVVVAPTGVAALNVNGSTIHSFFRFPPRVVLDNDIQLIRNRQLYRKMKLLIIDEISMVRADVIDAIDLFLRRNREVNEPFGGVQLLMVGDLFQLPPVIKRSDAEALALMEYDSPYFFSAKVLKQCSMVFQELNKIYRQSDPAFISVLNQVRAADSVEQILPVLNQRHLAGNPLGDTVITLACTNRVADSINDRELGKLNSPLHTFAGEVTGKFGLGEDKLPSPINLSLKSGAQVMFTKNDSKKRWVNGTLGRVAELSANSIRVEIANAPMQKVIEVKQETWESYKYLYDDDLDRIVPTNIGSYFQYPLMLAWAVTIHKSQGKTLEKVRVDLGSGAFDYGQVYVALSRCRSLEDIHLVRPVRHNDIKCDPVIKRFYEALNRNVTGTSSAG